MNGRTRRQLRLVATAAAIAAPLASHVALAWGQSYGAALACSAAGAAATGLLLWTTLPRQRWLGPAVAAALGTALILGARHSPQTGLLAATGLAHALLYTALLALFARSLRPGRTALVTLAASRINPHFHPGMIPYTRKVTAAWTLLFAAQLILSATLLATNPALWQRFVTTLHFPLCAALALAEALIRRHRWRGEHPTSLPDTIRGVRRLIAQRANSSITS